MPIPFLSLRREGNQDEEVELYAQRMVEQPEPLSTTTAKPTVPGSRM